MIQVPNYLLIQLEGRTLPPQEVGSLSKRRQHEIGEDNEPGIQGSGRTDSAKACEPHSQSRGAYMIIVCIWCLWAGGVPWMSTSTSVLVGLRLIFLHPHLLIKTPTLNDHSLCIICIQIFFILIRPSSLCLSYHYPVISLRINTHIKKLTSTHKQQFMGY